GEGLGLIGTAAPALQCAGGSGSSSQVPHSPPQYRSSTDTEVEDCCPICLGSCGDPSFVMPCLHRFCYACILQWAKNKAWCPLCKRKMTSILHSVAQREPDAPNPPRPGDHQQGGTAGDVQDFVGGFQLPNWMSSFATSFHPSFTTGQKTPSIFKQRQNINIQEGLPPSLREALCSLFFPELCSAPSTLCHSRQGY
uniref:RING-type E3 ubiquitin transferase n=1 Tax=Corvus moneduloides TaxID=1196302 RepID=A0A8C3F381_CORMO